VARRLASSSGQPGSPPRGCLAIGPSKWNDFNRDEIDDALEVASSPMGSIIVIVL